MSPEEKPFFPIWSDREKWYVRTGETGEAFILLFKPMVERSRTMLSRVLKAFPNVFAMIEEVVTWATGLVGLALTAPFLAIKEQFLRILRQQKLDRRLIRLDDAVDGFFNAQILSIKQITFTSETGLIYWILGRFGRSVYRFIKRWRLISGLIKSKSEAEFINVLISTWKRRAKLIGVVGLVFGFIAWLFAVALSVCFLSFAVNFGEIYAYLLPQDSKRVRGPRKQTQYRVNIKRGPDA